MANQEKTKLVIFKPKHQLKIINNKKTVHVALSVKNLDVYFDTSLSEETQINAILSVYYIETWSGTISTRLWQCSPIQPSGMYTKSTEFYSPNSDLGL